MDRASFGSGTLLHRRPQFHHTVIYERAAFFAVLRKTLTQRRRDCKNISVSVHFGEPGLSRTLTIGKVSCPQIVVPAAIVAARRQSNVLLDRRRNTGQCDPKTHRNRDGIAPWCVTPAAQQSCQRPTPCIFTLFLHAPGVPFLYAKQLFRKKNRCRLHCSAAGVCTGDVRFCCDLRNLGCVCRALEYPLPTLPVANTKKYGPAKDWLSPG